MIKMKTVRTCWFGCETRLASTDQENNAMIPEWGSSSTNRCHRWRRWWCWWWWWRWRCETQHMFGQDTSSKKVKVTPRTLLLTPWDSSTLQIVHSLDVLRIKWLWVGEQNFKDSLSKLTLGITLFEQQIGLESLTRQNHIQHRPSQLAELSHSKFEPELFSHSTYVKFFCDIRDKSAVFNILGKNETNFGIGNG